MVITTILHKLFFFAPGTACSQEHLEMFFVGVGGGGEGVNRVYFGGLKNTVIAFMSCETQGERIQELQSQPVNKRPSELI